jgi:hypothetical protein
MRRFLGEGPAPAILGTSNTGGSTSLNRSMRLMSCDVLCGPQEVHPGTLWTSSPHDLNAPPKHLMVRMMPPCHIRGSFLRQMRHGASANNTAPIIFPLVFMRFTPSVSVWKTSLSPDWKSHGEAGWRGLNSRGLLSANYPSRESGLLLRDSASVGLHRIAARSSPLTWTPRRTIFSWGRKSVRGTPEIADIHGLISPSLSP